MAWFPLSKQPSMPPVIYYIFFLLSMSYEAFYRIRQSTVKQISASVWFSIIFLVLAEQIFKDSDTYDFKIFYISGAFILIYALPYI